MNVYVVFPLEAERLQIYAPDAARLRGGTMVAAKSPERAALAVRGDMGATAVMRFAVVDATLIDFEPVPGTETMPTDEGPHR